LASFLEIDLNDMTTADQVVNKGKVITPAGFAFDMREYLLVCFVGLVLSADLPNFLLS